MAKFYESKKIKSIGKSIAKNPVHALGNAERTATSIATFGLLSPKDIKNSQPLNFLTTGSVNPQGNPTSRGDVPTMPKALPPTAQLPNVPFQSGAVGRRGKRRRANGTILTGPRGFQSGTAGKTILGG